MASQHWVILGIYPPKRQFSKEHIGTILYNSWNDDKPWDFGVPHFQRNTLLKASLPAQRHLLALHSPPNSATQNLWSQAAHPLDLQVWDPHSATSKQNPPAWGPPGGHPVTRDGFWNITKNQWIKRRSTEFSRSLQPHQHHDRTASRWPKISINRRNQSKS